MSDLEHSKLDLPGTRPPTNAEVLHQNVVDAPARQGAVQLLLDLDVCDSADCEVCPVRCSYFYHPGNNGVLSLRETAAYALICRRCERPHCVEVCPKQALEQGADRQLVRHLMRCVGCRSCSLACPYGTILPDLVPYLGHNCDYCLDRCDAETPPLCSLTCPLGAIRVGEAQDSAGPHTFRVGNNLLVHSKHWNRERA